MALPLLRSVPASPDPPPVRRARSPAPAPAVVRPAFDEAGYRLVGVLGRGATSVVYEAIDRALGLRVALKVLDADLAATNPDACARFDHEARMLARLAHPCLVRPLRLGRLRGSESPFLALELLRGTSLRSALRRAGALDVHDALKLVERLLDGLAAVHEAGVVHRDVKPENVVLVASRDGVEPRLVDFGAARLVDSPAEHLFVGTFDYAPPEQLAGAQVGPAADLYACGVLLCELVTGRRPRRFDPRRDELHARRRLGPPGAEALDGLGLPRVLTAVVQHALESDPERRPASAHAFARELALLARLVAPVCARAHEAETRPPLVEPWGTTPAARLSEDDLDAPTRASSSRAAPPDDAPTPAGPAPVRAARISTLVLRSPPRAAAASAPFGAREDERLAAASAGEAPAPPPPRGRPRPPRVDAVRIALALIVLGAAVALLVSIVVTRSPVAREPGTLPRASPGAPE